MSKVYWCWSNLSGSIRRIWQNIKWGWNESDCWSLDYTVSRFVLPRLKYLKQVKAGCPMIEGFDTDTKEGFQKAQEEWNRILDKMIFSFDCIANKDYDMDLYDKHIKLELPFKFTKLDDREDSYELTHEGTEEELNIYKEQFKEFGEASKLRLQEIQEGLDLFAKYFSHLWD